MKTLFLFAISLCCVSNVIAQNIKLQTPQEFAKSIDTSNNPQIIDVRTAEEFKNGHLKNAMNVDWKSDKFDEQMSTLDKTQPVFLYCLSGGRSAKAAEKMRNAGFRKVHEMSGGMIAWRANNLHEIKPQKLKPGMSLSQYQKMIDSKKLVLVDFYAEWCAPCKKMEPYLNKIAKEMGDQVDVVRINADENPELCKALNVSGLPVLHLYKEKRLVWNQTGFTEEAEIRKHLHAN